MDVSGLQNEYHTLLTRLDKVKEALAAQGAIVRQPPYAALYIHATRALMSERDRQALHVLVDIANHADELGWCYPSVQTLGQNTGYAVNTVESALSRLMAKDWLRVAMSYNPRRKRLEKDFMLSPAVIYIRAELEPKAWDQYQSIPYCNNWTELETKHIKPYTRTSEATNYSNQHQEPTTEPPPPPSPKTGKPKILPNGNGLATDNPFSNTVKRYADSLNLNLDTTSNSAELRNSNAQNHEVITTPPVPPHPPLPEGFNPAEKLADARDESAAQELKRLLPTLQIRHARRYIARYDRELVLAAANVAVHAIHTKNPVGKMDYDLRMNLIDKRLDTPSRSIFSGDDSSWIEG